MPMRWLVVVLLCAGLIGGAAMPSAGAQAGPTLIAGCFGTDHPPFRFQPPPGFEGNSILVYAGSIRGVEPGSEAELSVRGPDGVLSGTGTIDDTGRVDVLIGIFSFGTYTVVNELLVRRGGETQQVPGLNGRSHTVGPDDTPCSKADLPPATQQATTTTTAAATTTSTSLATTTTQRRVETIPTSEPVITKRTDEARAEDDDDLIWILLVGLGLLLVVIGLILGLLWRRRDQTSSTWITETLGCDWAVYYDEGGNKKLLRQANGMECCVYTITVVSHIGAYQAVAQGRQMPDQLDGVPAAPEGRLRLPDYGVAWAGMDLDTWASVRSGPAGRLDWMQATAPPTHNALEGAPEDPDFRPQMRSHEEPPDVAAHLFYWERHEVSVVLTSSCPGHINEYEARGGCDVTIQASEECSNTAGAPECPVEFTAQAYAEGLGARDLTYSAAGKAMSDPDELEGKGLERHEGSGGRALVGTHLDTHDHLSRPVETSEQMFSDGNTVIVAADAIDVLVQSEAELDAGIIVPARVWDTTERVSADVRSNFTHDLIIAAEMEAPQCPSGTCCGHGTCLCDPKVSVEFRNGTGEIFVDGKTFNLTRPGPASPRGAAPTGVETPWQLT